MKKIPVLEGVLTCFQIELEDTGQGTALKTLWMKFSTDAGWNASLVENKQQPLRRKRIWIPVLHQTPKYTTMNSRCIKRFEY